MPYWLVKTEPETYSFAQLQKEKRTVWSGVQNPVALKNIRAMKVGDEVFVYHTGKEKAVVGIAKVVKGPYPDPTADDDRSTVIDLQALEPLKHPVKLGAIKADPRFAQWELVRISRLSVMPVPRELWKAILELAAHVRRSTVG